MVAIHTPFSLNESIPHCPAEPHNALKELGYPTSTIIYVIYAVTTLVFATIIAFKYNSVKVFNKKIRTQNISNTLWIIYYVSVGVKACVNAGLYGITQRTEHADLHGMLFDAVIILNAINAFTLCLSLNHQRKYRSSAPSSPAPQVAGSVGKEAEPLIPKMEVVKRMLDPIEIVFFILFTASLVLYYVALLNKSKDSEELFTLIFVGSFAVQRLPIFVLSLVIVGHRNGNEGPTRQSKVYLFFAAVFHLVNELPVFFLAQLLPGGCILLHALSWIDILITLNYISLILFFLFLRSEYLRNMEECIWTTVSQIQDTFDFRRF